MRPTCKTCWFSRVKAVPEPPGMMVMVPSFARHCLRDPLPVEKDDGDFCQYHPAWPEFEAVMQGEQVSDFYDDEPE